MTHITKVEGFKFSDEFGGSGSELWTLKEGSPNYLLPVNTSFEVGAIGDMLASINASSGNFTTCVADTAGFNDISSATTNFQSLTTGNFSIFKNITATPQINVELSIENTVGTATLKAGSKQTISFYGNESTNQNRLLTAAIDCNLEAPNTPPGISASNFLFGTTNKDGSYKRFFRLNSNHKIGLGIAFDNYSNEPVFDFDFRNDLSVEGEWDLTANFESKYGYVNLRFLSNQNLQPTSAFFLKYDDSSNQKKMQFLFSDSLLLKFQIPEDIQQSVTEIAGATYGANEQSMLTKFKTALESYKIITT